MAKNKKGMTLAETLVAIIMTAVMLVIFLQHTSSSAIMLQNIKFRVRATNIARADIEDVKALGYAGIDMAAFPRVTNVLIDEGPTLAAGDDVNGVMTTTVRDTIAGPVKGRKIVVQINYNIAGQAKEDIVETVLYSGLQ